MTLRLIIRPSTLSGMRKTNVLNLGSSAHLVYDWLIVPNGCFLFWRKTVGSIAVEFHSLFVFLFFS